MKPAEKRNSQKISIAKNKVAIATEAHRKAEVQFSQQMITTAALLDRETELLQAQLQLAQREAEHVELFAKYQHAAGFVPLKGIGR